MQTGERENHPYGEAGKCKDCVQRMMAQKMKIVINALQYCPNGSGIAVNLRELFGPFTGLTGLPCRLILPKDSPPFPCADKTDVIFAPCDYGEGLRRILYQSFVLGKRYCRDALLLTVDSKIPLVLPKTCRVIPEITDLALFRMAETYQRSRVLLWKMQYRFLCRRAERFIAISAFTKNEMTQLLGIPQEKIDVVYCAARQDIRRVSDEETLESLRSRYHLPRHYILFLGNFNPRKNLARLIRAFDRMKRETELPHELVIAGGQGWKFSAEEALAGVAAKKAVHFIGYVPDEEIPALYSAAALFAFPTLYEGFGIPLLEAQQCGTPVLTSNVSALPEVGGDGALYVNPYDEEEIAKGMEKLLADRALCEDLIRKGYRNAERFSWEASAAQLNQIIERLVGE